MSDIPKQMAIERNGFGSGHTEREALFDWLSTDDTFLNDDGTRWGRAAIDLDKPVGCEVIREPFKPKRTNTEIHKQLGARKWDTIHLVIDQETKEIMGSGNTKAEGIKLAREIALDKIRTMDVVVSKKLIAGNEREATITPKNPRPGKFKFRATFKY
jgi:hypothetical protein